MQPGRLLRLVGRAAILLGCMAAVACEPAAGLPSADLAPFERARAAAGGQERFASLTSLDLYGTLDDSWAAGRKAARFLAIVRPDAFVLAEYASATGRLRWYAIDKSAYWGEINGIPWNPDYEAVQRLRRQLDMYMATYFLYARTECGARGGSTFRIAVRLSTACGEREFHFSPDGMLIRMSHFGAIIDGVELRVGRSAGTPVRLETRYAEHRVVGGWRVPHAATTTWPDKRTSAFTLKRVEVNNRTGIEAFRTGLPEPVRAWLESNAR